MYKSSKNLVGFLCRSHHLLIKSIGLHGSDNSVAVLTLLAIMVTTSALLWARVLPLSLCHPTTLLFSFHVRFPIEWAQLPSSALAYSEEQSQSSSSMLGLPTLIHFHDPGEMSLLDSSSVGE